MSEHAFEDTGPSGEPYSEEPPITIAQANTGGSAPPASPPLKGRVIWTEGAGATPAKDGECTGAPQETIDPAAVAQRFVATDGAEIKLPEGAPVTKIIVVGDDVYLLQSDGKAILIEDGASEGAKVIASGKDILSGPLKDCGLGDSNDGEGTPSNNAQGAGGGVLQSFGDIQPSFPISPLLPPTQLFEKNIKDYPIPGSSGNGSPTSPPFFDGKPQAGDTYVVSDDDDVKCQTCEHGGEGGYGESGYGEGEGGGKCGNGEEAYGDDIPSGLTGILPHSFGPDGPGAISFSGMNGATAPFTSGGEQITYVWSESANTLSAITVGTNSLVFTVHVHPSTGAYEFQQFKAVDHHTPANVDDTEELNVNFVLSYTVTDADGDTATGSLHVSIDDDTPVICYPEDGAVDEDFIKCGNEDRDCTPGDKGGEASAYGSLGIKWGADCYDASSEQEGTTINTVGDRDVAFKDSCIRATDAYGQAVELTSCGVPITYCLNDDGTKLTAFAGEKVIFEVTLNDDGSGSYHFELKGPLDHYPGSYGEEGVTLASYGGENSEGENCEPGHSGATYEETITLEFCFVAHDSDLDKVEGSFKIAVNDDAPYATGETVCMRVDEDALEGSNADGERPGEVDGGGLYQVTNNLTTLVSIGADKCGSFSFVSDITEQLEGLGLKSNGCPLEYSLCDHTLTAKAHGEPVFTLSLSENGEVTFTLFDNLDHPPSSSWGEEGGSCAANENTLSIDFSKLIQVSDGDHDTILLCDACGQGGHDGEDDSDGEASRESEDSPSEGCFVIKIVDDVPVICTPKDGYVDEDALPKGNHNDGDDASATACGDLGIKWGADDADNDESTCETGDRSVTFCGVPDICLTSKGHEVTFTISEDGKTLLGSACGETVIEVCLSDDGSGSYKFELKGPLDHPAGHGENDIALEFSFKATDSDGDCATGTFTVTVNDDSPVATCATVCATVYEDGLGGSHHGEDDENDDKGGKSSNHPIVQHGTLAALVSVGADCPASFAFADNAKDVLESQNLKSDGECLSYCIDGNTLTATADGEPVFTLTLDENGCFTFCLEGNLDHPDACEADTIAIDFSKAIQVSDGDHDTILLCDACGQGGHDGEDDSDGEASRESEDSPSEGCFVIKIVDSVPCVSDERICVTVDEDDLANLQCDKYDTITGSRGTSPGDGAAHDGSYTLPNGAVVPGYKIDLTHLVSFGGDTPGEFGIVIPNANHNLTSKGKDVSFKVFDEDNDGVYEKLVATSSDKRTVFTLEVGVATGLVLFTLFDQVDHALAQGQNALTLDIGSFLTAIDADGDHTSLAGHVDVKIVDDVPTALSAEDAHLDNKSYSTEEFSLGSYGHIGADDNGKVVFIDNDSSSTNNYLVGTDGQYITYNGDKIALTGYGTETLTGKVGNTQVIEIHLNPDQCDKSDDTYTVKLFKELDDTTEASYDFDQLNQGHGGKFSSFTVENIDQSTIDLRITAYEGGHAKDVNLSAIGVGVGQQQGISEDEKLVFDFFNDKDGDHAYDQNEAFEVTSFSFSVTQNNPTKDNANFEIFAYDKSGNKIELEISDLTFNPGSASNPNKITVEESGNGLLVKGVNGGNGGLDNSDDHFTLANLEGFSKITIEYDDNSKAKSFDVSLDKFSIQQSKDLAFNFDIQATDYDGDKSPVETVKVSFDGDSNGGGHSGSYQSSYLDDGSEDLFDDHYSGGSTGGSAFDFVASLPPPPPCGCEDQVPMAA